MCRYKARWVAKSFEQRKDIDFEETFFPVVKSCITRILLALPAFYGWSVEQMNEVTGYLKSEIDLFFHTEAITGYKTLAKVCLPRKKYDVIKMQTCTGFLTFCVKIVRLS